MLIASTNWTAVAAIMSGAAAVGTLVLAGVTVWLGSSTRNMSTKTGELADETKRLADSTGRSVDLAERELEVLSEQARATNAQVVLSTEALKATQQPTLVPVADAPTRSVRLISRDGQICQEEMGQDAKCWQGAGNGPIWVVIPIRNIGAGPAMIPSEDKSLMASLSLFGGISTFGRPSQRVVAPGDIVHLVFQAPAGATPELNLVVTPEESGTCGSVVVRYSGIDRSHLTQTRLNYRQFTQPLLLDALVTVTPVAEP